ncbi:hypothetical protein L3X38_037197 [Prunus dulcis]|uniref:Reverse transcriptase Ty1/copia-type domain-containing protein n=1 Tax=Prunus dulcis TaxID=3755 RepID=A0AAD4V2M8_PRUDU|nr:hypothetical protein L3X38_037197 [Prunus dulcis]
MSSIRVVFSLATSLNLEIEQLKVKTAFLHEDLEEEIYMEQPEGFKVKGKEDLLAKIYIDDNSSDMMTKSLPKHKYDFYRRAAGLLEPST